MRQEEGRPPFGKVSGQHNNEHPQRPHIAYHTARPASTCCPACGRALSLPLVVRYVPRSTLDGQIVTEQVLYHLSCAGAGNGGAA